MGREVIYLIFSILLLEGSTLAQVFFPKGDCPYIPVIKDFDWHRYLGKWYEQERYFTLYEEIGKCWTGTYIKDDYGDISVKLNFIDYLWKRNREIFVDVKTRRPKKAPSRFTYTIPGVPVFRDHYEVAATDYDNWTIEYSCSNKIPKGHSKFAWILTRDENPSDDVIQQAKAAMTGLGIDPYLLKRTDKSCYKAEPSYY